MRLLGRRFLSGIGLVEFEWTLVPRVPSNECLLSARPDIDVEERKALGPASTFPLRPHDHDFPGAHPRAGPTHAQIARALASPMAPAPPLGMRTLRARIGAGGGHSYSTSRRFPTTLEDRTQLESGVSAPSILSNAS